MSNPVFERMKDSRGYATFGPPGASRSTVQDAPAYGSPADLETMYNQPSATSVDTGRMTYDDVVIKTALVFVAVLVGGVVGWQVPGLMLVGLVGGLVLGLVNSFKKNPSPALILGYGLLEGVFLGGISNFFDARYPGIVVQAVLGTLSVFAAVLVGFRSGKLRTSPKLNKIFFIAIGGYLLFSLVNLGLMLFAGQDTLRQGPLGLAIGAFAVLLASYSLVMDFEFIKVGVEQAVPAKFAWTAAFGLVVTLVWLYIEILRILSILRGD
ncbi:Bax inhibitor-1/YccA family protein [Angustibacter peucedani]